jgi:hypothetical protein
MVSGDPGARGPPRVTQCKHFLFLVHAKLFVTRPSRGLSDIF